MFKIRIRPTTFIMTFQGRINTSWNFQSFSRLTWDWFLELTKTHIMFTQLTRNAALPQFLRHLSTILSTFHSGDSVTNQKTPLEIVTVTSTVSCWGISGYLHTGSPVADQDFCLEGMEGTEQNSMYMSVSPKKVNKKKIALTSIYYQTVRFSPPFLAFKAE